tara:strand:+ start:1030 stop:1953 length:924 start_codon:yes stop_codon:yes gene_type:complete
MEAEALSLVYLAFGKWLTYLGLAALTGAVSLKQLIGPARIQPQISSRIEQLLQSLAFYASALVIAAVFVRLYAQTFSVFGLDEPVTLELVRVVGFQSRWGGQWQFHSAVAILTGLATVMVRAKNRFGWNILTVFTVVLWLTLPLSGHAMSFSEASLLWAVQVAHGLAAGVWMGTLFALFFIGSLLCTAESQESLTWFATLVRRFSRRAIVAVTVLVVTGIITSWFYLGSVEHLWRDPYGRLLSVKMFLVFFTALIGAYNWRYLVPRLNNCSVSRGLFSSMRAELILGVFLLAVTAVLVHLAMPAEMG